MKGSGWNDLNKEEICEDCCFHCKDGGSLFICDYQDCLKAYHAECLKKEESFFASGGRLTCEWHTCYHCQKSSKYQCYCCPKALCHRCYYNDPQFARVRGCKGFCIYCAKVALLAEESKEANSDGIVVDFKDKDTYEGLFFEYWLMIKKKEGLTYEDLRFADIQLRSGENQSSVSNPSENSISNFAETDTRSALSFTPSQKGKRPKVQKSPMKRKVKSKNREFIGWGSKPLIEFLVSIGKDTSKELSQYDVQSIINRYINEEKLFLPAKRKQILCDERLITLFGKKTFNRNKIYDLLEDHFLENVEFKERDEPGYSSEEENDNENENILLAGELQENTLTSKKIREKEVAVVVAPRSCFASIVAENIKLVYLKRCLVMELLKQRETFESMMIGSFVKVKSDPYDYMQKNPYQLVQVTGVNKTSLGGNKGDTLLQVSNMLNNIPVRLLLDAPFSEEECADLRQRVKNGQLPKLTIVEIEEKAKSLHQVLMKHWIDKELDSLQNQIDRANEKGRRAELFQYMERRQVLQTEAEQMRLLQAVPRVVAEEPEVNPICPDVNKDSITPKSNISNSKALAKNRGDNPGYCGDKAFTVGSSSSANMGSISAIYEKGTTKQGKGQGHKQGLRRWKEIVPHYIVTN